MGVKLLDQDQLDANAEWIGSHKPLGMLGLLASKTRSFALHHKWYF
jgi:hypothetical protein